MSSGQTADSGGPAPNADTPDNIAPEALTLPSGWHVDDSDCDSDGGVLIVEGPRDGEYLGIDVRPNGNIWINYRPRAYDRAAVGTQRYQVHLEDREAAIDLANEFFETGATAVFETEEQ